MNDKKTAHFEIIEDAYWKMNDALDNIDGQIEAVLDDESREALDDIRWKLMDILAFSEFTFERWLVDYAEKHGLED